MSEYRTKGQYGLGGQVHIANKNSNVDYDYGAYDSFEAIPETLYDTVQVGKTIGVVDETGKIKEYWWQMQEDGTYGWCEKGISREEVEAILDNYTAKDDIKKEVINVLTAADTAPEDMEDGDLYIATNANKLFQWSEDSDDWIEQTPDIEVIYKTLDENEMYVWNGTEFSEVGGDDPVVIDDTIYVGKDYDIPAAAADLPAGTYTAIVLEHVLESVILTSIGNLTEQEFIQFLKYDISGNTLSLKDCETLVANIETIPIDLNELGFKVTDEQMDYIEEHEIGYISGSSDREAERFTLLKISNDEMFLQTRKGWASMRFPIDEPVSPWTIKDVWEWHYYDYQGHKHTINEIEGAEDLIDHTIEDDPSNPGYLILTIGSGASATQFAIQREQIIVPIIQVKYGGAVLSDNSKAVTTTDKTANITLECTNIADADIYYTKNGDDPTLSTSQRTKYNVGDNITFGITTTGSDITTTSTLKVAAYKNGKWSEVRAIDFAITRKLKAPTGLAIAQPSGSATTGAVSVNNPNSVGTLRYTTNGDAPTAQSDAYSNTLKVGTGVTVKMAVFADNWVASDAVENSRTFAIVLPTISAGGDQDDASRTITIDTTNSTPSITLVCKKSSDNGSTWTDVTLDENNQFVLETTGTYKVKIEATKTGWTGSNTTSGNILVRILKAVTVALKSGTDTYDTTRIVTASCASSGVTLRYTTDGTTPTGSSTEVPQSGEIAVSTIGTNIKVTVKAFKTDYTSSQGSYTIDQIGKKKCYIGQAASVTTLSDVESLANAYEEDTLVGSIKNVNVASSSAAAQYTWFAIPNTAAKNLVVTVNNDSMPTPVPLQAAGGELIPSTNSVYRVWRSKDPLFNLTGTYDFKFA